MNGVENINSVFDDDVSRFVALFGVYPQNVILCTKHIFKECW